MTLKYPLLCLSHTVRTAATLRCDITGSAFDTSFPRGVYWTDPVYGAQPSAADSTDLLHLLAYKFDVANGGAFVARPSWSAVGSGASGIFGFIPTWSSGEDINLVTTHANTNAGGRALVKRLGGSQVTIGTIDATGVTDQNFTAHGMWMPGRAESGDMNKSEDGRGDVAVTESGAAYAFRMGGASQRRVLTFLGVEGRRVFDRMETVATTAQTYAFQRTMLYLLQRGEKVRYYQDYSAARTYLTADMSATDDTCDVYDDTGFTAGLWIWINGEAAKVTNVASDTLTLSRPQPVAHSKYDPVSTNEVGTYVLDKSGSDLTLESFAPDVTTQGDFVDFSIPLLRSA